MRLVLGDPNVPAWVAARIPQMDGAEGFGPCVGIGVVGSDGEALGGVVFHNWHRRFRNIEVSFASASPRWLTANLIRGILSYPYTQLDCLRVTAVTPRKAASARRFLDVFGFKREGLVRKGFGTDDAVISGLLRTEFQRSRWATRGTPQKGDRDRGQRSADSASRSEPLGGVGGADAVQRTDGAVPV